MKNLSFQLLWLLDKVTLPGWTDIRQTRSCHTFYWIREGKGIFKMEDQEELQVHEGMLFYFHPGLQLTMETDALQPLRITMVFLSIYQSPMTEQQESITMKLVEALPLPLLMSAEGETANRFDTLFYKLLQTWIPGQLEGELAAKSLVYELIYQLFRQSHEVNTGETEEKRLFLRIKDDLDRYYFQNIRLKSWTRRYGISESYFRTLFSRYAGQSPKSYLNCLRCEHAKRQLLYTNRTMREIADSCGYGDEFQFSKSFKKTCGIPPKEWRMTSNQKGR